MAQGSINRIHATWQSTGMLTRIVLVNIAVFVTLRVIVIAGMFSGANHEFVDKVLRFVELPGNPQLLLTHPWTILTYMFAQYDVLHILFNMLWLYWFGALFMGLYGDGRRLLSLYIYGGLGGAVFYILACILLPPDLGLNGWLIGSSASVIAIVVATAILMPDYRMLLWFNISVALKWVAIITIGLDLITIVNSNIGGHFAHLGGAAVGALYAILIKRGIDITRPFTRVKKYRQKSYSNRHDTSTDVNAELDELLDKIKKSGYTSLTDKQRKRLFELSRKIK